MRRTVVSALLLVFAPIIAQAMDGHFVQARMIKWEAGPPGLPVPVANQIRAARHRSRA